MRRHIREHQPSVIGDLVQSPQVCPIDMWRGNLYFCHDRDPLMFFLLLKHLAWESGSGTIVSSFE